MTVEPNPKKPRAKRKTTVPKGITFQSRGAFKCVKVDGVAQTGVHHVLQRKLHPGWNYKQAKANGTLRRMEMPKPQYFVNAAGAKHTTHKYPPGNAAKQGTTMDRQLDETVALHNMATYKVPTRAFYDSTFREHFIRCKWGTRQTHQATKVRTVCNAMLRETELAWRFFGKYKLDPISTQDTVAGWGMGTKVDVVAVDATGDTRVLEMKKVQPAAHSLVSAVFDR